jgi:vesicle coat complex subunit
MSTILDKNNTQSGGGGSIYFTNTKNSELSELQEDLDSMKIDQQKEAMKQIIASMTLGKDVSSLFPYVVKCMRTQNIELKKLIYLYIINYARTKPDQAILAVNAFHQDATDKNSPLIRALAVRTMGCIRVDMIVTYLCETLKMVLKDEDAYVRKTGCICVAKLFNTCPSLVIDNGFIQLLQSMETDGNSIVVANALVALSEISILSGENYLIIKSKTLKRILAALQEANEWGQVYILDSLINYNPKKNHSTKSEEIIESVIPRLSHANPAVVMSALKVILKFLDLVENVDNVRNYSKKISGSLMTVITSGYEIQYLLLRSMHAIVQKRPGLLDKEFRYFFIQYTDPVYIKMEKMDILYKLADSKNFEFLMQEFKSYACLEFDIDLVTKAVKYLGNIAFKFEKSSDLAVEHMKEILDYNQDFTVNQGIIVVRDLMRKYKTEKSKELLKKIDEKFIKLVTLPESKAALLYIIGEYCNIIKNSTELIQHFSDNFNGENEKVKLQIMNAVIKNFVNKPDEGEELVKIILQKGGEETLNPDVRDRAYIYWRLLELDPDSAKEMIVSDKPSFEIKEEAPMDSRLVDDIIMNLTNVSAIYHKFSRDMITKEDMITINDSEADEENSQISHQSTQGDLISVRKPAKIIQNKVNKADVDLLGLNDELFGTSTSSTLNTQSQQAKSNFIVDIFGTSSSQQDDLHNNEFGIEFLDGKKSDDLKDSNIPQIFNQNSGVNIPKLPHHVFKSTDKGKNGSSGIEIYSLFHRENNNLLLGFNIKNNISVALSEFSIILNSNSFGITCTPESNPQLSDFKVNSEMSKNLIVNLEINNDKNNKRPPESPYKVDMCLRNNIDDFYFSVPLCLNVLLTESGKMTNNVFLPFYRQNNSSKLSVNYSSEECKDEIVNENVLNKIFERNNIFEVAKNNKGEFPLYYYSFSVSNSIPVVIEASFPKSKNYINIFYTIFKHYFY